MKTLKSAKIAFEAWRVARPSVSSPIPEKLWDMVEDLLPIHKKSKICKILRLSGSQLKKHCNICAKHPNVTGKNTTSRILRNLADNGFVKAVSPPIDNQTSMSELTLKLRTASFQLKLPTYALSEVLPMVRKLL